MVVIGEGEKDEVSRPLVLLGVLPIFMCLTVRLCLLTIQSIGLIGSAGADSCRALLSDKLFFAGACMPNVPRGRQVLPLFCLLTRRADAVARCLSVSRHAAQAPMLYCGEQIGDGAQDPKVDIAVDPLDGTTLISQARPKLPALIDMLSTVAAEFQGVTRRRSLVPGYLVRPSVHRVRETVGRRACHCCCSGWQWRRNCMSELRLL